MNKRWIWCACWLVLGCVQTMPPATVAAPGETQAPPVQRDNPVSVDAALILPDAEAVTSTLVSPVKQAKSASKPEMCTTERNRIETVYQHALAKPTHRACKKDHQCLLLPNRTLCSNALCIRESAPVNRTYAKTLKAIQYEADLKTCDDLTQECKPMVHKRRGAQCGTRRFKAVCDGGLCTAKAVVRAPKVKPKAALKAPTRPKATKPKKPRKAKTQKQSHGAQLILGETKTPDRRYKMDITQSLMFARNAAFDACLEYPGSKNGTITFQFSVTPRGALGQLREIRSSLPKRMSLCLKTWLKSLEYPAPKGRTATVSQVIRYIAP